MKAFRKKFNEWRDELHALIDEQSCVDGVDLRKLQRASKQRVRQAIEEASTGLPSRTRAVSALEQALTYADDSVLEQLGRSTLTFEFGRSRVGPRGYYLMTGLDAEGAVTGKIGLPRSRLFSGTNIVHEVGHHIESLARSPQYKPVEGFTEKAAALWRDTRARAAHGGKLIQRRLRELLPNSNYRELEMAVVQGFIDPYVGKIYSTGVTEVVSVGLQQFADEKSLRAFMKADWDHFSFTYAVLSGVI